VTTGVAATLAGGAVGPAVGGAGVAPEVQAAKMIAMHANKAAGTEILRKFVLL
jgi:hypothetical protein